MRFGFRKTVRIGPLYWIFNERGYCSWGIKVGPYTRNLTRGSWSLDTPGPGAIRGRSRRR